MWTNTIHLLELSCVYRHMSTAVWLWPLVSNANCDPGQPRDSQRKGNDPLNQMKGIATTLNFSTMLSYISQRERQLILANGRVLAGRRTEGTKEINALSGKRKPAEVNLFR